MRVGSFKMRSSAAICSMESTMGRIHRSAVAHRIDRPAWPRRDLGLLVVWFAHSHSASQFLQHLPSHWNSDILPPHCGQTKLMIDERMLVFDSPGRASKVFHNRPPIQRSDKCARGRRGPQTTEIRRAGLLRSRALRTGWLRSPSRPPNACRLAAR